MDLDGGYPGDVALSGLRRLHAARVSACLRGIAAGLPAAVGRLADSGLVAGREALSPGGGGETRVCAVETAPGRLAALVTEVGNGGEPTHALVALDLDGGAGPALLAARGGIPADGLADALASVAAGGNLPHDFSGFDVWAGTADWRMSAAFETLSDRLFPVLRAAEILERGLPHERVPLLAPPSPTR